MKRLYYLVDDLETTRSVVSDLRCNGVGRSNLYVWGRNDAGLQQYHIHRMNPLQRLDIIHSGEQGAILGLCGGLLLATALHLLQAFPNGLGWIATLLVVVLVTMFGAWVGGIIGVSHEHYKISRFHPAIEEGMYLVVVEAEESDVSRVRALMQENHGYAHMEGMDTTINNPLAGFPFQHLKSID